MPCVKSDGTLSKIGILIIRAVQKPANLDEISHASGLPPFRARSALRGLRKAGLVTEKEERFCATPEGLEKLGG